VIIENESNWRTDDLEALLKSVMKQPSFQLDYGMHDSTLVLFITNRKKPKTKWRSGLLVEPDAADWDANQTRYDDTRIIGIRSAKALEMQVLDKLAHIGECVQHMNVENIVVLAQAIWVCLGRDFRVNASKVEFAKRMNMRTRPKVTRSKLAVERRITALGWQQNRLQTDANKKIRDLDKQVSDLKSKLRNMR